MRIRHKIYNKAIKKYFVTNTQVVDEGKFVSKKWNNDMKEKKKKSKCLTSECVTGVWLPKASKWIKIDF